MPIEFIDGNTLRRIANLYNDKKVGSKPISDTEYRDTECSGLCIKVRKRGATWCMLTREINAKIGDFHLFKADDIETLRDLVAEAKVQAKAGHKPDALFKAFRESRDVKLSREIHDVAKSGAKTWEEARDEFLAWAMVNKATSTAEGYRSALGASKNSVYVPDFKGIAKKPVVSITLGDLSRIKESIVTRGSQNLLKGRGLRQADLTVAALRSCWKYMLDKPSIYRLEHNVALGLSNVQENGDANEEADDAVVRRPLTQLEIGAFIHGLDSCGNEIARLVLFFQLLTGQRRRGAVSAIAASFKEHDHYGLVWRLRAKGNNWRVLPLPEMAQQVVRQAIAELSRDGCKYLFPKERHRTAGDNMNLHIHQRTVSEAMITMRGPGEVFHDLDIKPATHLLRKGFVSFMRPRMHEFSVGGHQLTPDDVKMITHANEGRDTTAASVYDLNDYLDVKFAILKRWEDYCLEGYTLYMQQQQMALAA